MQLRYTSAASADLEEIALYTAKHWGKAQAEKFLDELEAGCDLLLRLPHLGRLVSVDMPGLRR